MKILIITHNFLPLEGGIATHTYEMAKNFSKHGEEVLVVASSADGAEVFDKKQNFKTIRIYAPKNPIMRLFLTTIYSLYAFMKFWPDLIYTTHWRNSGIPAWIVSIIFKKPHFSAVNGSEINFGEGGKFIKWLFKRVANGSARVVALGNYQIGLLKKIGIKTDKIRVIPEGVNIERFDNYDEKNVKCLKNKYEICGKKVILTIGRLGKRKGHDYVISALPYIIKKHPDALYIIVGRGPEEDRLKRIVKDLNLGNNVIFTGFVDESTIPDFYRLCDVFIMANRIVGQDVEGFGIVFVEANVCSKPAIAGATGGTSDIIENGFNGFLVNPENKEEIAEKILYILENPEEGLRMGKNGRAKAEHEFNYFRISGKLLDIFKENG